MSRHENATIVEVLSLALLTTSLLALVGSGVPVKVDIFFSDRVTMGFTAAAAADAHFL